MKSTAKALRDLDSELTVPTRGIKAVENLSVCVLIKQIPLVLKTGEVSQTFDYRASVVASRLEESESDRGADMAELSTTAKRKFGEMLDNAKEDDNGAPTEYAIIRNPSGWTTRATIEEIYSHISDYMNAKCSEGEQRYLIVDSLATHNQRQA